MQKIKERFYWPGYETDIRSWLQQCEQCQRRNPPQPSPRAPLGGITANQPFEKVSWDIMGPLPASSKGNKYILVVTDLFSKWVEAFPMRSTESESLATILVNEIVCRYGVPQYLHSDQGANLTSKVIQNLCKKLGIQRTQSSAYHPQGNGQVERFNRTLEAMLAKMVKENQRDWDQHLPRALFAYRTAVHDSTTYSPFHVNFRRSPMLPVDVMLGWDYLSQGEGREVSEYVEDVQKSLRSMFSNVRQRLAEAHRQNKNRYDERAVGKSFTVGDRVWLYVPVTKQGRSKKFTTFWRGPYTVIDKTSPYNYRIQLIGTTKTFIVHRNRLKLCHGDPENITLRETRQPTPIHSPVESMPQPQTATSDSSQERSAVGSPTITTGGYTTDPDLSEVDNGVETDPEHDTEIEVDNGVEIDPERDAEVEDDVSLEHDNVGQSTNSNSTTRLRPQCVRRPPDYGPFISH